MKKKIKRISKMVMTIVLTATMLFGQLPSGLVLVANADTISGNGNSTLPDMSAGAAKYFNPDNGGGQIGDPKSLPDEEETSEEESEEDKSESSSIEEESDSSKEKVEANSEKEIQSEEKTSEEKTSEEKTSESAKKEIKDGGDDDSDVGETDSEKSSDDISDGDEPESLLTITPISLPTVTKNDISPVYGDLTNNSDLSAYYSFSYPEGVGYTFDEAIGKEHVSYTINDLNAGDNKDVTISFTCNDGFQFEGDSSVTVKNFKIEEKEVTINSIIFGDRTRPYAPGDTTIPGGNPTYVFEGELAYEDTLSPLTFELKNDEAGNNKEVSIVGINFGPNYKSTQSKEQLQATITSNIIISPKEIQIKFDNTNITKVSDGTKDFPDSNPGLKAYAKIGGAEIQNVTVEKNEGVTFEYSDDKPAKNILVNVNQNPENPDKPLFIVKENGKDRTKNYDIDLTGLVATIIPKKLTSNIELDKNSTSNAIILDNSNTFKFNTPNVSSLSNDKEFWFNLDSGSSLSVVEDEESVVKLWKYDSANEEVVEAGTDYYNFAEGKGKKFENVIISKDVIISGENEIVEKGTIFYGPCTISYNYDKTPPAVGTSITSETKWWKQVYKMTKEGVSESGSGLFDRQSGLVSVQKNESITLENYNNWGKKLGEEVWENDNEYIWYCLEDNAQNKVFSVVEESQDKNAPTLSVDKVVISQDESLDGTRYFDAVSFDVTAEDTETGVASVDVILLDGTDSSTVNNPGENDPRNKHFNYAKYTSSATQNVGFDGGAFGYQLHLLFIASDHNGKSRFEYGLLTFDEESSKWIITLKPFADTDNISNRDDAVVKATELISEEDTFAIIGTGDNAQKVTVDFGEYANIDPSNMVTITQGEEVITTYYYQVPLTAEVKFSKMGEKQVTFVNTNEANNKVSFSSFEYNPSAHCYEYIDTPDSRKWTFGSSISEEAVVPYIIGLGNNLKFGSFDNLEKFSRFVVDDSKIDIQIITNPATAYASRNDKDIFNGAVNAKIIITAKDKDGKNASSTVLPDLLDKNIREEYLTIEALNNDGDLDSLIWTATEDGLGYETSISFKEDGKCSVKVTANSLGKQESSEEIAFYIDQTPPEFDISYVGSTNKIKDEGKTVPTYFFGLVDGVNEENADNYSTMTVEFTIKDACVLENEISYEVLKDGVSLSKDSYDHRYSLINGLNQEISEADIDIADRGNTGKFVLNIKTKDIGDGEITIHVSYEDPVGHKMISVTRTIDGTDVKPFNIDGDGNYVADERVNIFDTTRPIITYSIDGNGNYYENDADYFNEEFKTTFSVEDNNYDGRYTNIAVTDEGGNVTTLKFNNSAYEFSSGNSDNEYIFSIKGIDNTTDDTGEEAERIPNAAADLAGNIAKIVKGQGTSKNDPDYSETAEEGQEASQPGQYTSGKKILDFTAPTVKLTINSNNAKIKGLQDAVNDKRFFFNDSFIATFSVTEKYDLDQEKVHCKIGVDNASLDYAGDQAPPPVDLVNAQSDNPKLYEINKTKDGLYVFQIEGTDKAGNKFVLADNKDLDPEKDGNIQSATDGVITSRVIVIDTTVPTLEVKMNDSFGEFYKAKLQLGERGEDHYGVETNKPYRKATEATIQFDETDNSPTSLDYSIASTKGENNTYNYDDFKEYVHNRKNITASIEGKQVYWFTAITVVDKAGNTITASPVNKIYLDEQHPENDLLAPETKIAARTSSDKHGPNNNPLYKEDVVLEVTVTDNKGETTAKDNSGKEIPISASGIYKVYFSVFVNRQPKTSGFTVVSEKKGTITYGEIGEITYNTVGWDINIDPRNQDEQLTYSDKITVTFPSGEFNYNDVALKVWTEDNAGNMTPANNEAYYPFGIDVTKPKITVTYNNNNAQNGKYFKDPRTATVAVRERNFDAGRTHISTESGAHVSGWSCSNGTLANGDDDTWTATIVYDTDGDYTLGVSTSDLVGWEPEGGVDWSGSVAPTEFTIDLTKPVIAVAFDNNRVTNGRYYNANRRATIDITEHNFDAKDATVERTAAIAEGNVAVPGIGNWARINDINRNEVYFGQDGDYTMKVDYVDLAGNIAETYVVDLFTIDTVAPELEIGGVEDKHAYNGKVAPSMTYHDINYDKNSAKIDIVGNKNKGDNSWDRHPTDERFGGSIVCDSIQEVRDNDDIYTAKASISDLAGNTTEKQVTFSVNRFGSTYIISDSTQKFLDKYYNQQGETLEITEINVNELASYGVTYSVDGNTSHNIVEGEEFTVQQAHDGDGWWEYNYRISGPKNFTDEGNYLVELKSRDGAANDNGNRFIQKTVSETYELPIEFVIDHSAPTLIMTGVEEGGRYRADERTVIIRYEDSVSFLNNLKVYEGDKLVQEYDQKQLSEAGGEIQYQAKASNRKQEIRLEAVDMAGNEGKLSSGEFLLTSSAFIQFINNTVLLIAVIAGLIVLVGGIIFLVAMLNRRKRY